MLDFFPSAPRGLKGRATELATLSRALARGAKRIALVGGGGSGKSMLAAALGRRVAERYDGRIHWLRVGAWDANTLFEILALRFGTSRERAVRVEALRAHFSATGPRLVVLDNHEDDRATAKVLDAFTDTPVTFVITARRCLLAGVWIFPVIAPLVTEGRAAFPRVSTLTRTLRFNPLALDVADAIVSSGAISAERLGHWLVANGVGRVKVIAHEDDLPEVSLLVDWAWPRLPESSRRMMSVLAHVEGDHVDLVSLAALADVPAQQRDRALEPLLRFRLVQEPLSCRYALHAVVRYAVAQRTHGDPGRLFEHYLSLLERLAERDERRLALEQTHLFTAMDWANRNDDLDGMLRIERLLEKLDA